MTSCLSTGRNRHVAVTFESAGLRQEQEHAVTSGELSLHWMDGEGVHSCASCHCPPQEAGCTAAVCTQHAPTQLQASMGSHTVGAIIRVSGVHADHHHNSHMEREGLAALVGQCSSAGSGLRIAGNDPVCSIQASSAAHPADLNSRQSKAVQRRCVECQPTHRGSECYVRFAPL